MLRSKKLFHIKLLQRSKSSNIENDFTYTEFQGKSFTAAATATTNNNNINTVN